jgi:hypothetical protein
MAHVTFIHGMCNKPPADVLLRFWSQCLKDGPEPLALADIGVTTSLVYWADLLYDKPYEGSPSEESVARGEAAVLEAAEIESAGVGSPPVPRNAEEASFIAGLTAKMEAVPDAAVEDATPVDGEQPPASLERVPLPWFVKKEVLNTYLRDVHHYLFDVPFAPPGREPVPIQRTIRRRFVDALCSPPVSRPHVVVSHSLGTVIAYDCLQRLADCPPVDGLLTIGSPLGLDEIQDRLKPEWSRDDGFPTRVRAWANVYDRLDPVCGFDPALANDFRSRGADRIEDVAVVNDGRWRHSASKYLRQPALRRALRRLLRSQP